MFEIQTCHTKDYKYSEDADFINGLPDYYLKLQENIPPSLSKMVTTEIRPDGMATIVKFQTFTPGSVIAFRFVCWFDCLLLCLFGFTLLYAVVAGSNHSGQFTLPVFLTSTSKSLFIPQATNWFLTYM